MNGTSVFSRIFGTATATWVGLALVLACTSPNDELSQDADWEIASVQRALSEENQRIFGFEDPIADWSIVEGGQGSITTSTERTQRSFSLAVTARGYVPIRSIPTSSLGPDVGETISYDLLLPPEQPNPYWFGATQFYVNAPSVGLWNRYIGQVELTGFPTGVWTKIEMNLPTSVAEPLRGTYSDLQVTVVLNVPYNATGVYLIDNMSFGANSVPDAGGSEDTAIDLCQNVVCAPVDQCHDIGTCDPATGTCTNPVKLDGTICNDGNSCTQTDICQAGGCSGTHAIICVAESQCHIAGTCDPETGTCSSPAKMDGSICDDNNPCTQLDQCVSGQCVGTEPMLCPLPPGCTVPGVCDPATGVCSEASGCEVCGNGILDPGEECDDGNIVSGDGCSEDCQLESCIGVVCPSSSDPCRQIDCNPISGECESFPRANGSACDDGNLCTIGDICEDGQCVGSSLDCGGPSTSCSDVTYCHPATGTCVIGPAPDNTPCDDGDACTDSDACLEGVCIGALTSVCFAERIPDVSPGLTTRIDESTAFLYSGVGAVQEGVVPGTIVPQVVSVARGKVRTRDGAPLGAVAVEILNYPEYGTTKTREDGQFDMVVNGGTQFTLRFKRPGYLLVDRYVNSVWQEFVTVEDVVMTPVDGSVTVVDFPTNDTTVIRGRIESDVDGSRQATVIFQTGTFASINSGSVPQLSIRLTEYTVGEDGPLAMPAPLPSNSAYSYALAITTDETISTPEINVDFSLPVSLYVENFVDFPVGAPVAVGSCNRSRQAWCAENNGRVIQIVDVVGGLALVDTNGSGLPGTGMDIGMTDEERAQLAQLYSVGQSLWRIPIGHFSDWDAMNPPFGIPKGSVKPKVERPKKEEPEEPEEPCEEAGSVIECEKQVLGQEISLTGVPYSLSYRSSRMSGDKRSRTFTIEALPLGPEDITPSKVTIEATVAGQVIRREIDGSAFPRNNPIFPGFVWDGLDAYGRVAQGPQPIQVRVGYSYPIRYRVPEEIDRAFAEWSANLHRVTVDREAAQLTLWSSPRESSGHPITLGALQPYIDDLGGWTLDVHHTYDPTTGTVYRGDGRRLSGSDVKSVIFPISKRPTGACPFDEDGVPVDQAEVCNADLQNLPNGNIVMRERRIAASTTFPARRIDLNNVIRRRWFNDVRPNPFPLLISKDGFFYTDHSSTYGYFRFSKNHPVTLNVVEWRQQPGMMVNASPFASTIAEDGALYMMSVGAGGRVFEKFTPCNILRTVNNMALGISEDDTPVTQARIGNMRYLTVGPDGGLYFVETPRHWIRRIGPDGILSTVAGTGTLGAAGAGGPATEAQLTCDGRPFSAFSGCLIKFSPAGELFIVDRHGARISKVAADGTLQTVAGVDTTPPSAFDGRVAGFDAIRNGAPAHGPIPRVYDIAFAPDNSIYASTEWFLFKITSPMPGFTGNDIVIADSSEGALYVFDPNGRHLRTEDMLTRVVTHAFAYNDNGQLVSVTDRDGLTMMVERNTAGNPTGLIAPGGQRTTLTVGSDRLLSSVVDPGGNTTHFNYDDDGLMVSMEDPNGNISLYYYNEMGGLIRNEDAAGGYQELSRFGSQTDYTVTKTTAEGRTTSFHVQSDAQGRFEEEIVGPTGLKTTIAKTIDGKRTVEMDGVTYAATLSPDPRFGLQAPFKRTVTKRMPSGLQMTVEQSHTVTTDPSTGNLLTDQVNFSVNSRIYRRSYSALDRVMALTTPLQIQSMNTLDEHGRLVRSRFGSLAETAYSYDERGRLSSIITGEDARARVTTFAYDMNDRLVLVTDPLGQMHGVNHDAVDRITQTISPGESSVNYTYDSSGNALSIAPPSKLPHLMTYSPVHLLESYGPPSVGAGSWETVWGYNRDKQVVSIRRPDGIEIEKNYDSGGRLLSITHPEGSRLYEFDDARVLVKRAVSEDGVETLHDYDGPLLLSTSWAGPINGTVARIFNNNFWVTQETVNGTSPVAISYDADGRLQSMGYLSLLRNSNGQIVFSRVGNFVGHRAYNEFGERVADDMSFGSTFLWENTYVRDKLGRITQRVETLQGTTIAYDYSYDFDGRLVQVVENGDVAALYSYDPNGNRLAVSRFFGTVTGNYDDQDRLLEYGNYRYEYTRNGEIKSKTDVVDGNTTHYSYDVYGSLKRVDLPDGRVVEYITDALRRRVGKKVNGVMVQGWLYSGDRSIAAELDSFENVTARIVNSEYLERDGQVYRLIRDHLGSVRFVMNVSTAAIAQRLDYDEFGRVIFDSNPGFQPLGFAGGHYDPDTGFVRFGARDYDAQVGRWTAKEPKGPFVSPNVYLYSDQDPINNIDPTGFKTVSIVKVDPNVVFGGSKAEAMIPPGKDAGTGIDFSDPKTSNKCKQMPNKKWGFDSKLESTVKQYYKENTDPNKIQSGDTPGLTLQEHEDLHKQDFELCFSSPMVENYVPTEGFATKNACEKARNRYESKLQNYINDVIKWTEELWDKQ